jgi:hypothetical protein
LLSNTSAIEADHRDGPVELAFVVREYRESGRLPGEDCVTLLSDDLGRADGDCLGAFLD